MIDHRQISDRIRSAGEKSARKKLTRSGFLEKFLFFSFLEEYDLINSTRKQDEHDDNEHDKRHEYRLLSDNESGGFDYPELRGRSADHFVGQPGSLLHRVYRRPPRQHAGHLRGVAVLENANCNEHVHREPGDSGRVFPNRYTVPRHNDESTQLDIREDNVQGLHDHNKYQPVHQQHIPLHHERGSLHRRLPSDLLAENSDAVHFEGGLADGLGDQRSLHDTYISVRERYGIRERDQLQHILAQRSRRPHHLHLVHVHLRLRHPLDPHTDLLLPRDQETADGGAEEQVEGEETISSQSDKTRAHRDHGVRSVLAALLADAGGAHLHPAQTVSEQDHDH